MKNILLSLILISISTSLMAQVPQAINYQAIARNSTGGPIVNTAIGVRFRILQGSATGSVAYSETFPSPPAYPTVITNAVGLFNLAIGRGTVVSGVFANINWSGSTFYLEVAIDPTGGTNYQVLGTASQFLSVPYALRSLTTSGTGLTDRDGDTYIETDPGLTSPDADEIHMYLGDSPLSPNSISTQALVLRKNGKGAGSSNPRPNTMLEIIDPTGGANTFIGHTAGEFNTTTVSSEYGIHNTTVGFQALNRNTKGSANIAIGVSTLRSNVEGNYNTAIGDAALGYNNGNSNTSVGRESMFFNTLGNGNTANGARTLYGDPIQTNNTGSDNTAMGFHALYSNSKGNENVALGANALYNNKNNSRSTAIGYNAMFYADDRTTGRETFNTAVGFEALKGSTTPANNTGQANTAIGHGSLFSNTAGESNTALGAATLATNSTGSRNTAIGGASLFSNKIGSDNIALGRGALASNITGNNNAATGSSALNENLNGSANTANGVEALLKTTGSENTAVGFRALSTNTTGNSNVALGFDANVSLGNLSNTTAIGAGALVTTSNTMILGNNNVNVGIGLSGVAAGPTTKLEISESSNAALTGSGLRFRNLTSAGPFSAAGTHVLSVDATGKVILVPNAGGGNSFIGYCTVPLPKLTTDAGIDLDGNYFYFAERAMSNGKDKVGIGMGCNSPLTGKLHVRAGVNITSVTPAVTAIYADAFNGTNNTGVYANASSPNSIQNYGVQASAGQGRDNFGVAGVAGSPITIGVNYGIYGVAQFAPTNYGGYFTADQAGTGVLTNYGIYARAGGGTTNNYAGYFVGNICYTGTSTNCSDKNLKENIQPLDKALTIISTLNPKTYTFKTKEYAYMNLPHEKQFGLIAQEVESVLPEMVKNVHQPEQKDKDGKEVSPAFDFKSLNYTALIPILIQGMKEQQAEIEDLKKQNAQLGVLNQQNQSLQTQLDMLRADIQSIRTALEKQPTTLVGN